MEENGCIRLSVVGLSYNQIHDGAYALILAEEGGNYRIPVIIGAPEAQSIAIIIGRVVPPRPLTHDLFSGFAHAFGIVLKNVFIYNYYDGVFSATMTFVDKDGREVEIDSRTSDAIAIAMRTDAPIFTTPEILHTAGFRLENEGPGTGIASGHNSAGNKIEIRWKEPKSTIKSNQNSGRIPKLQNFAIEELEQLLQQAVVEEEYEKASEIKAIINIKKQGSQSRNK